MISHEFLETVDGTTLREAVVYCTHERQRLRRRVVEVNGIFPEPPLTLSAHRKNTTLISRALSLYRMSQIIKATVNCLRYYANSPKHLPPHRLTSAYVGRVVLGRE